MSKIWTSSDFHYGHRNICDGTSLWKDKSGCRKFNTIEEHDELILKNINELVKEDDTFYVLGDFIVGSNSGSIKMNKREAYIHYRKKINCKNIIYIRGNHSLSRNQLVELGIFKEVCDYYELDYNKNLICMFHFPIRSWNRMSKSSIHIFGHQHSNNVFGRSMDVGVDGNNFKPYLLDDVIEKLKNNTVLTEGHHV